MKAPKEPFGSNCTNYIPMRTKKTEKQGIKRNYNSYRTEGQTWCNDESCLTPCRRFELQSSLLICRGRLALVYPIPRPANLPYNSYRTTYITTGKYIIAPQVRSTHFVSLVIMFEAQQVAMISSYLCYCIAIIELPTKFCSLF